MFHKIFPVGPLQCNCSIIGDETTRDAIVIDPGDDIADVLALIQKHNLQVKQIVITRALGYGLTTSVIHAARQIKFQPAIKDDIPVSVYIQLEYNFNLY